MVRRQPHIPGAAALAVEGRVQARLAREFELKNQVATRSLQRNAAVIGAGAVRNAELGLQPFLSKRRQRRGKR
jgi:hypothetical protein